jgi:hypothetical protein
MQHVLITVPNCPDYMNNLGCSTTQRTITSFTDQKHPKFADRREGVHELLEKIHGPFQRFAASL